MLRSYWIGPLFGVLAATGLAQSQTTTSAAPAKASETKERYVTVGDLGKPGQKCRVLKTWTTSKGNPAYQVQALDTGELMTIEESEPAAASTPGAAFRPKAMRIFHWGRDAHAAPHGSPEPPAGAVVIAQPIDIRSAKTAPPLLATAPSMVSDKAPGKWPSAFTNSKPGDSAPASTGKCLTSIAPPALKKVELTPVPSAPVVKAQALPLSPYSAKAPDAKIVLVPSSSAKAEAKPADSPFWNALTTSKPAASPAPVKPVASLAVKTAPTATVKVETTPAPSDSNSWNTGTASKATTPSLAKLAETPTAKASSPATVKVETTLAKPSDWRESWGKIPPAKSAPPIWTEKRSAMAAAPKAAMPKVELPHAVVKADDPLSTPEKFAALQDAGDGAFGRVPVVKETKRPLLARLAINQSAPTPKIEEKKPERPAATIPPPPPVSITLDDPIAPAAIAPPAVVMAVPPAPAQIVPPTTLKAATFALVDTTPVAAEVKPEAKPVAPLGMQSALAVRSPELAPPAPQKPTPSSQAQAMGIDAEEPNAFSAAPPKETASTGFKGFWAPKKPAAPANPQADAKAGSPPSSPAGYTATAAAASGSVVQAGYRQENSSELSQLSTVMRDSLYPSQREWAAERLASIDWRRQPQVLDLLIERAKQDQAPTVRAECVRSLGRLKSDAPPVVEAVKSCQADADPRVRQEAEEALAILAGATPAPAP